MADLADSKPRAKASVVSFITLLRPKHWIKNVVVFAAPAAGMSLANGIDALRAFGAFVAFCLASSAIYAINDAIDHKADAQHPTKFKRPVASGAIHPGTAVFLGILLMVGAIGLMTCMPNPMATVVLVLYIVMMVAYSTALKSRVILDVLLISLGFVLRAVAGALAVNVPTSEWLVACVFTLCLFLGFGKRLCEMSLMPDSEEAGKYRKTLMRYTAPALRQMFNVSAGIAVITFLLYTMEDSLHQPPFPKRHLFYTLPIVVYGIFRFAMVADRGKYAGPTEVIINDRPMLVTILVWAGAALLIAYQNKLLGPGGLVGLLHGVM